MAQTIQESVAGLPCTSIVRVPAPVILRGITYGQYVELRGIEANNHIRMVYHDGILEIMAPASVHEIPSRRLGVLIAVVAEELDIPYEGTRSTTIHRGEKPLQKGQGKEPDESFYFANAERIGGKEQIDLNAGDPPPDLWVEVDNRSSAKGKLPVYAGLGVPEVWRYRVASRRLWFGRLVEGDTYEEIDRSLSLPMLTPALALEALALGDGVLESTWTRRLREWIRGKLGPPAAPPARPGGAPAACRSS
jgi:Uma2 family endonuclease